MTHALKTWPQFFQDVSERGKNFEVRLFDRPFKVGEKLILQEYDPKTGQYTGDEIERIITYILEGGQFGIEAGYVVMGLEEKNY